MQALAGVFLSPVHCVLIGNDGLVYVCDRLGDRIEVFRQMGNFIETFVLKARPPTVQNSENTVGTAGS